MIIHHLKKSVICITLALQLFINAIPAFAMAQGQELTVKERNIAINQEIPIESNETEKWPQGPVVNAASAILLEADTGTILYAKDIHSHHYPASITKILTTLIAYERCSLEETVTFSKEAVFGIPRDSNHIAMNVGETLTMEQCLNAILIRSANEVSYAVAEHVGGSFEGFAQIMNERAAQLGCVDSHFVNPNGLPNEDHYVSAYDMAMIGRAFFDQEVLCNMTMSQQLVIPKKDSTLIEWSKMDLLPNHPYAYEGVIGCKTGYTNDARSTLVSCAVRNGLKLICVVLQDEAPSHYEDTHALFDYGFSNFEKVNIAASETKYNIDAPDTFFRDCDFLEDTKPLLTLDSDCFIVLPKGVPFSDSVSELSYDTNEEDQIAYINYTYSGVKVGRTPVSVTLPQKPSLTDDEQPSVSGSTPDSADPAKPPYLLLNPFILSGALIGCILLFFVLRQIRYQFHLAASRRKRRASRTSYHAYRDRSRAQRRHRKAQIRQAKRRHRKRYHNEFRDYDF